jgi:hypothetical protein
MEGIGTMAFQVLRDHKALRTQLEKTRHESLIAARQGDYRRVAQLTVKAARLNQALAEAAAYEGMTR